MIKIGITGSIGSGKSSVTTQTATQLGIPVFDADKTVHDLYATDHALQDYLVAHCGPDILSDDGIDRKKLSAFKNMPDNRKAWHDIEAEVRGRLWNRFDDFTAEQEAAGQKLVIADVPLLFETSTEKHFDYTVNVFVPAALQKRRALERATPKLTEEEFEKRLAVFMPTAETNAKADFVVDNAGEIEASVLQLRAHLRKIEDRNVEFAQNKVDVNEAAVYVGSFDPITLGHLDVVKSAAHMPYKKIYVAVGVNPAKKPMFSPEERRAMIEREMDRDIRPYLPEGREIVVTSYEGLTVDFMKTFGASLCIRGLRGIKDLEEENDLAAVNKGLYADNLDEPGLSQFVQAYFATSKQELRHVSSSIARGICSMGPEHDLSLLQYVSPDVAAKMIKKRNGQNGPG